MTAPTVIILASVRQGWGGAGLQDLGATWPPALPHHPGGTKARCGRGRWCVAAGLTQQGRDLGLTPHDAHQKRDLLPAAPSSQVNYKSHFTPDSPDPVRLETTFPPSCRHPSLSPDRHVALRLLV